MRSRLVVGNWKMHGSIESVTSLLAELQAATSEFPKGSEVGVCPTFVHLPMVREQLAGSAIRIGAQNANAQEQGAFTGEVSAQMLAEFGVHYVLVGHSERRQLFAESDATVAEKFLAVQASEMTPILCLGETLEQRERGETDTVVLAQLDAVIRVSGIAAFAKAVVAYEPIWAIGTGRTASPEQAQAVHKSLRQHVAAQAAACDRLRGAWRGAAAASDAARRAGGRRGSPMPDRRAQSRGALGERGGRPPACALQARGRWGPQDVVDRPGAARGRLPALTGWVGVPH